MAKASAKDFSNFFFSATDSSWRRSDALREEGSREDSDRYKRRELDNRRDIDTEDGRKRREPERRDNRDEDERFRRREPPLKDSEDGERYVEESEILLLEISGGNVER